jgi:hypothetical protein
MSKPVLTLGEKASVLDFVSSFEFSDVNEYSSSLSFKGENA